VLMELSDVCASQVLEGGTIGYPLLNGGITPLIIPLSI
jgi:hypothetical protein